MCNEELAVRINGGERDRRLELWEQVRGLIAWYAVRRYDAAPGMGGVEVEDLIQAGYIAMEEALEDFDPEKGYKFSTYLVNHLKTAFAEAGGYRSEKQKRDPLLTCDSLDRPVGDDGEETLGGLQPAPGDCIEEAEERVWLEQLRAALDRALDDLPGDQQRTVDRHYYRGESLGEIAASVGVPVQTVRNTEVRAMRTLRKNAHKYRLQDFLEERAIDLKTPWYLRVSPAAFLSTGTSAVEKIILQRERDREHLEEMDEYIDAAQKSIERDWPARRR